MGVGKLSHDHECDEFRCPPFLPADAKDDFCIPEECCPEQIPTPKFPSPNSCLPQEELEDLERRIAAANELLLSLALSRRDPGAERAEVDERERLRGAFEGIKGQLVAVEVAKADGGRRVLVQGVVCLVGRDFVLLEDDRFLKVILPEDVCSIKHHSETCEHENRPELIDIDPCLRRAITLDFGATVAQSPELIQIFFGIDLRMFLRFQLGKLVRLKTRRSGYLGRLEEVCENELIFQKARRKRTFAIEDITLLKIKKDKKQRK